MNESELVMRCSLPLAALMLAVFLDASASPAADPAYSAALSSTLRIEDGRGRTLGAAVCLGEGIAVTAAHVVRDHKPFRVVGVSRETDWQRVPLALHPSYELALIQAPSDCTAAQPASPKVTDEVFTVGFPENGWEQHASFGRVGSVVGRYVRTNIVVVRGNSGGGLWTLDGKLIAICSGRAEMGSQFIDITPAVQMVRLTASRVSSRDRLR